MSETADATTTRKVAIVGAAPSSRDLAPYKDESWEIWACSPSARDKYPRITAWFELHDLHFLQQERYKEWAGPYLKWLQEAKHHVVMQAANDVVPKAIIYPWDRVKALSPNGGLLLTSSIAEMIALGILEDVAEIAIYGVDMAADSEWGYELPGCQLWIARARDCGIKVTVPDESSLDHPIPIYGLDDANPKARKLREHSAELVERRRQVVTRLNAIDAEKAQLLHEHYHLDGAIEQNNWVRKTFESWSGPDIYVVPGGGEMKMGK